MAFTWDQYQPAAPTAPANGSSYGPSKSLDAYLNGGTILDPYTKTFAPPSEADALNSPGLQFAINEAFRVGQAGAAAKGNFLNGRVQAGLQANAIGTALQGYGDEYNRSLGRYLLHRENFQLNQDRPFGKLSQTSQQNRPQASS